MEINGHWKDEFQSIGLLVVLERGELKRTVSACVKCASQNLR
jgi:hypothetical protein